MKLEEVFINYPETKQEMLELIEKETKSAVSSSISNFEEKQKVRNDAINKALLILKSDAYKGIHGVAFGVIDGSVTVDALIGAQAAYDAIVARKELDSTKDDNVPKVPADGPKIPETKSNVISSYDDLIKEISEIKGVQ